MRKRAKGINRWREVRSAQSFDSLWEAYTKTHDDLRRKHTPRINSRWGYTSVLASNSPWKNYPSSDTNSEFPHMLTEEEISYLSWLGREMILESDNVVEIGPWLGKSSRLLTYGNNCRRRIITVDDFIWRSVWMDPYVPTQQRLSNHDSFLELFRDLNVEYLPFFEILQRRLNVYEGNNDITPLNSFDLPERIDCLFVDCGRTIEVNETWWSIVKDSLVSGESLVVMQDWRLWRESPQKSYNQTLFFTQSHQENLKLIHEVSEGGLAAFLFV